MDNSLKGFPEHWVPTDPDAQNSTRESSATTARAPVTTLPTTPTPATPPQAPSPTSAANSANEPASEEQIVLGQELAALFKNAGVHPVLIFGSRGSGKTSMLASLFR